MNNPTLTQRPLSLRRSLDILFAVSPALLAVLAYGYAISLPFFLDDGPHFMILAQTDGLRHWGDFAPFPFYRPLTFTLWKLFEPFGYNAAVLHWLNVLCFGVIGVLTGTITSRLSPPAIRHPAAIFAGWFVVLFPFSYQAVAMVAALFHLTLTLGLLLSLWAGLKWLDRQDGRAMLLLCWLAAFVGVFSHENGVLLFPLMIVLIAAYYWGHLLDTPFRKRLARIVSPVGALVLVYGVLWLKFSPHDDTGLTTDLAAGLAVLTQGLIYPLAAGLRPFISGDIQPELLLVLAGSVTLVALVGVWWRSPAAARGASFGLFWYMAAILPAAVVLSASYVLGQPRLALLASVGGGVFWGITLAAITHRHPWMWIAISVVFFAISGIFLIQRRADFLRLRDWNREAVMLFEQHHAQETGAVLVNAPDYITPAEENRLFVLGTEGALFVDETLDYNQQFWMNSETDFRNIQVYAVPGIQRNEGFGFRSHPPVVGDPASFDPFHTAEQIYVTQFDGDHFKPPLVGGRAYAPTELEQTLAVFGQYDAFELLAAHVTLENQEPTLTIELTWKVNIPAHVKTFTHVLCDSEMVAQSDGYPWGDLYPFAVWEPGEVQTDIRTIQLESQQDRGCLQILTGLYTEDDVIRLVARDAKTDEPLADSAYVLDIDAIED